MAPSLNPVAELGRRRRRRRLQAEKLAPPPPPVPYVVGVNRSGTTLLRMMLDSHPELAIPPETHFIPALYKHIKTLDPPTPDSVVDFLAAHRRWGDFGISEKDLKKRLKKAPSVRPKFVLREFYGLYAEAQGKERYGDKTPGYVKQMGMVQRCLPEARFVHLIRDGRDVALSRDERVQAEELSIERLAKIWKRRIGRARRQTERLEHYMEVRYEDLVTDPETQLRRVCDFAEIEFDPAMLRYHERSGERLQEIARDLPSEEGGTFRPAGERLGAHSLVTEAPRTDRIEVWRREMEPADLADFERIAGDLLEDLGYPLSGASSGASPGPGGSS